MNCDEFERGTIERICTDTVERLEKNYGAAIKFVVIGIYNKHRSVCTSPMTHLETIHHLTRAALSISTAQSPLEQVADLYTDDANEVS
jgi:hypothetical protein